MQIKIDSVTKYYWWHPLHNSANAIICLVAALERGRQYTVLAVIDAVADVFV